MIEKINIDPKYQQMFKDREDIFFYFLYGGRMGSKTYTAMRYVLCRMIKARQTCVYCQQTKADLNTAAISEWENMLNDYNLKNYFHRVNARYTYLPNGSSIVFKGFQTSSEAVEAMKGFSNLSIAYVDEAQSTDEEAFDNLIGSIRSNKDMKLIVSLNPSSTDSWLFKRYFKDLPSEDFSGIIGNKLYVYSNYKDVEKYVGKTKIDLIQQIKKTDPIKYQNQYLGKWLPSGFRSLWSAALVQKAHENVTLPTEFQQIVIGVDPAATNTKKSDETGIIVVGFKDGIYYVLEQATGKYSPLEWALKIKQLYEKWNANYVVAQVNMGGDLVQANIRNVCGEFIYIEKIHASKGKILRAQPVAALYQQNLVKHIKIFEQLEYEMQTFSGNPKDKSPNSLDACVHAITYLAENAYQDCSGF